MTRTLHRAPGADLRIGRASEWLAARAPSEEILVVAASADAAHDLLRTVTLGKGAAFGWHRATLGRLAAQLALPALVGEGVAPVGMLATEAVVARVLHAMREAGGSASLGRYGGVADGPGFARAVARTLAELRVADVDPALLAKHAPELAAIALAFDAELARAHVCDRARVLRLAVRAALDPDHAHPLLGLPTLLLDVAVANAVERELVEAVAARAPEILATVPSGDVRSRAHLEAALAVKAEEIGEAAGSGAPSLRRLQAHLFERAAPRVAPLGGDVAVLSAPGESRECVEIARRIRRAAEEGVTFDAMAVLLRSPEEYRPHLEEAFARAGIPAHFARGALRPDPSGRAFQALLACAAEGLSARRFAEYLSLGEVPDATPEGGPPPAAGAADRWVAPDEELVPEAVAEALGAAREPDAAGAARDDADPDPSAVPVVAGTLRAPRRWERLLVDAAVIGGRERWERRLAGLERELGLDLGELDDEDPRALAIRRNVADLAHLRAYALPLLDTLAALPRRAAWGAWLDALSALATRALRHPDRVLAVLSELAPMAEVGPVDLEEVARVLSGRLLEVAVPPGASRYGRVLVAPADAARGLSFARVFVPGLAEKLFPHRIAEEPILLDETRAALGAGLATNEERIDHERLALRLAVGAAREQVVLSYPRLDLDQGRPRVPSFYALEALRAAEGRLPGFDELARRAERNTEVRVGWPAPARPEDALDEAEHDLALLDSLLGLDPEKSVGTARYLLTANPHLGRALRFRARRWLRRWTPADGLVEPSAAARAALREHALSARSFSPTALQDFAECPYRFFLAAVHRLAPREVSEAIEEIPPLERGSLVHEVQFELFRELGEAKLLPVRPANLERARGILDGVLERVAERWRDELAPAIERVWQDGVAAVRADLREWLRRTAEDPSGFAPFAFELAFGLVRGRERDPRSTSEAVALDCGIQLRGSIDLVERASGGPRERLRVTDHKTGKERVKPGAVVDGGRALQPVLYALAAEKLFPEASVESGRLYYCTATGGFEEREVPLDATARASVETLSEVVGGALDEAFLPAAPAKGACRWCDYVEVCGPYEELRTGRKPEERLAPLAKLRELR